MESQRNATKLLLRHPVKRPSHKIVNRASALLLPRWRPAMPPGLAVSLLVAEAWICTNCPGHIEEFKHAHTKMNWGVLVIATMPLSAASVAPFDTKVLFERASERSAPDTKADRVAAELDPKAAEPRSSMLLVARYLRWLDDAPRLDGFLQCAMKTRTWLQSAGRVLAF